MVRVYRDPSLRARLCGRRGKNTEPIRWALMKERYLDLSGARALRPLYRAGRHWNAGGRLAIAATTGEHRLGTGASAALKLWLLPGRTDWAGNDPYDALNSGSSPARAAARLPAASPGAHAGAEDEVPSTFGALRWSEDPEPQGDGALPVGRRSS